MPYNLFCATRSFVAVRKIAPLASAVNTTGELDRGAPLVYFVAAQFAANFEVLKPFPYSFIVGSHLNLSIVHRT
jgi:hypothetical protein